MVRGALFVLFVALAAALSPGSALAHAVLVGSNPADGERLQTAPASIVLNFSEPVRPIVVRLLGPGGPVIGANRGDAAGARLQVLMPPDLPAGGYVLSFRVTSIDGHPVGGSIVFGIGAAAATIPRADIVPNEGMLAVIAAANRAVHYFSLLGSAGGALFILMVLGPGHSLQPRLRRDLRAMAATAAATLILALGINGAELGGLPVGALLALAPWQAGASTTLLQSGLLGLAGLGVIVLGPGLANGAGRIALAIGALLALASPALTGHAASAPPRWASTPAVLLHVAAASFWLGALWPLAVILRHAPAAEAERLVRRFSTIALPALAALIAAGLALSIVQIAGLSAIDKTTYGRIWLVKMVLIVVLLGLAVMNREILTPRLAGPPGDGAVALRRSIAFELALMAAVLTATALLGQTPPPRALDMRDHAAHAQGGHSDAGHTHIGHTAAGASVEARAAGAAARIMVLPAMRGRNTVTVKLTGADGTPLDVSELTIAWSLPAAGIEPFERALTATGGGAYSGEADLPAAGLWTVSIAALVSDFEKLTFRAEIAVIAVEPR